MIVTNSTQSSRGSAKDTPAGALETILAASATPYGYTLSIWSSGALLMRSHGTPSVAETFIFVAGAITGFSLLALITEESRGPGSRSEQRWDRLRAGVLDWLAVGAAMGAVSLLAEIHGWVPWLVAPLTATVLYLVLGSLQLQASKVRGEGERDTRAPSHRC
jgi:hypothetical protein